MSWGLCVGAGHHDSLLLVTVSLQIRLVKVTLASWMDFLLFPFSTVSQAITMKQNDWFLLLIVDELLLQSSGLKSLSATLSYRHENYDKKQNVVSVIWIGLKQTRRYIWLRNRCRCNEQAVPKQSQNSSELIRRLGFCWTGSSGSFLIIIMSYVLNILQNMKLGCAFVSIKGQI